MEKEVIVKGKIGANGYVKPLESLPINIKGDIYIAIIPPGSKKYIFGDKGDKFHWAEDNPIIEMYKDQKKKKKAKTQLLEILDEGFDIKGKVYSSRNELYEK